MTYLLDSNTCIRYLNGRAVGVLQRLHDTPVAEVVVCSIVKAELFYGAMRSVNPMRTLAQQQDFLNHFVSPPFDDRAAEVYGRIRADLAKMGTPIGPNDLMIAAIALANDVTLVTHNTREFGRVADLRIEDWEVLSDLYQWQCSITAPPTSAANRRARRGRVPASSQSPSGCRRSAPRATSP